MNIEIEEYTGGYRPTVDGYLGSQQFSFRMMFEQWSLTVGKEGKENIWWHSNESEVEFETTGNCEYMYHTESVPFFLKALKEYLVTKNLPNEEVKEVLREAENQCSKLLKGSS